MSDYRVSEHTKLSGLPDGWANSEATQRVVLWDLGPQKPVIPTRPEPPIGKEGDPKYDLAMIEFRAAVDEYGTALQAYRTAKREYDLWIDRNGGPIELTMWSCDAADALQRDEKRYCISSKTRGYERLKNRGLPKDVEPGHGQGVQEERARQGLEEFEQARRSDPVFGQQEIRQ